MCVYEQYIWRPCSFFTFFTYLSSSLPLSLCLSCSKKEIIKSEKTTQCAEDGTYKSFPLGTSRKRAPQRADGDLRIRNGSPENVLNKFTGGHVHVHHKYVIRRGCKNDQLITGRLQALYSKQHG